MLCTYCLGNVLIHCLGKLIGQYVKFLPEIKVGINNLENSFLVTIFLKTIFHIVAYIYRQRNDVEV